MSLSLARDCERESRGDVRRACLAVSLERIMYT